MRHRSFSWAEAKEHMFKAWSWLFLQQPISLTGIWDDNQMESQQQVLPNVTPTIFDPTAPNPQTCPGYKASYIAESLYEIYADLTIAGPPCNVFGRDIADLVLYVSYQAKGRLNVRIQPKYIGAANSSWLILNDRFVPMPGSDGQTFREDCDLKFTWSNEPTFQFAISRRPDGEVVFSTFGHMIVYEDQFLELVTNMVDDYNVYGLAENIRNFRLGNNYTQTLFNADTADAVDANSYSTHPFYQETRYHDGRHSTAHGVYARNAHGQEWLMREKTLTYRAIGGSLDFYFLSGQSSTSTEVGNGRFGSSASSSALEVFREYQFGCVGLPAMQMYWAFGFHQCHWGWNTISDLKDVVEKYAAANIPLESIWNDIDLYQQHRVFTNDPIRYPSTGLKEFGDYLHERGQHYVALQDSNVYFPDPANETDVASYPPFTRGAELGIWIRDPRTGYFYIGENWPGYSVWADWLSNRSQDYWTSELRQWHDDVPWDALWLDLNECQSFCTYSCGNVELNSTANETTSIPLHDPRDLNHPPYKINNAKPSKQIVEQTIALNAVHDDEHLTVEYDVHSLWSIGSSIATYTALKSIFPGRRPFTVTRSTFAGSGQYTGHWGGDNESKWGAMFLSISQALTFMMAGIPMFGTDTCGFSNSVNATEELCARWMELNAFFPFYRNHYADDKSPQEAYMWPTVAEASRRVIAIRYSLLTYIYTLFYYAHTQGSMVMRALAWEFPNDTTLRATDTQFMLGPSLLVTPVLKQNATTVSGVFPGIGEGTRWFDWYTLQEVKGVRPLENVTMEAPLEHINLHVRGGSILPLQDPGNTTATTRNNSYALLVTPDVHGSAYGSLYLDDGESITPSETKMVEFFYQHGRLRTQIEGDYHVMPSLANITIAGVASKPDRVVLSFGQQYANGFRMTYNNGTLVITELEQYTQDGAWESKLVLQIVGGLA